MAGVDLSRGVRRCPLIPPVCLQTPRAANSACPHCRRLPAILRPHQSTIARNRHVRVSAHGHGRDRFEATDADFRAIGHDTTWERVRAPLQRIIATQNSMTQFTILSQEMFQNPANAFQSCRIALKGIDIAVIQIIGQIDSEGGPGSLAKEGLVLLRASGVRPLPATAHTSKTSKRKCGPPVSRWPADCRSLIWEWPQK